MKTARLSIFTVFALGASFPCLAQDTPQAAAVEKWRPKDGVYAVPGADLAYRCSERTQFFVDLPNKSIGADEYDCRIRKLTDTGAGAIRLDVDCTAVPSETAVKEVMLVKKINETTISYRGTSSGKFRYPSITFAYCPEDVQQAHREGKSEQ